MIASTGDVAHCLNAGGMGRQDYETETMIAHAFDARQSDVLQYGDQTGPLDTDGHSVAVAFEPRYYTRGNKTGGGPSDVAVLKADASKMGDSAPHVVVSQPIGLDEEQNAMVDGFGTLKARTAGGGFEGSVMTMAMQVRRLTPVECERLQGFPDGYTAIPWRGKGAADCPDGPRYKALGNSMAVPVMRWLGARLNTMVQA